MRPLAILTIVSSNYLHFARTLMQSVAAQHPEADRYCVIVDRETRQARALVKEFQVLELGEIGLPDGDDFLFQYNILELNTAVKPWAIETLFERGYRQVFYIDPDIAVYRPLNEVLQAFSTGADVVLTPHLLSPMTDDHHPAELDIRCAGTYNLGFCALSDSANTRALLDWWQGKLRRDCIIATNSGIFVDQSWMDLVPAMFPNVCVLRHPGYNVAYWNLAQRSVERQGKIITVNGEPLVFFHYSGLNPREPLSVSKHQNRFILEELPPAAIGLIEDYCASVIANGIERYQDIPYGFGTYEDGTPILDADRIIFRNSEQLRELVDGKPFASKKLLTTIEPVTDPYVKEVYIHLLSRKPDSSGQESFAAFAATSLGRLRLLMAIAFSSEARARSGWLQRLLLWPFRHVLPSPPEPIAVTTALSAPAPIPALIPKRANPYGGLYTTDADCAENGLWVGPRLDLPTVALTNGVLEIQGWIDLKLLKRGGGKNFTLQVHDTAGLIHQEKFAHSGAFSIKILVNPTTFNRDSQWTILASTHVVPKDIDLGEDTRPLSWRLKRITLDKTVLVDSRRSPVILPITRLSAPGGLNLVGYLSAELGVGEAARSLASACVAGDIPFSAVDVGYQSSNQQRDQRIRDMAVKGHFPIDLLYVNADQTTATLEYLRKKHVPGLYRIGFWHWEQPRIPDSVLSAFSNLDEVWVSSTFVHDAVAPFSPVPVVKIPLALEFSPSPNVQRATFGLPEDKTLVLVMYDFLSYQYRKNPQAALNAFRLAAGKRSDAVLILKTINSEHRSEARVKLAREVSDMKNVVFIDDFLTRQQTWDLQSCCDILLSLHRAEGFGLALAEMMYLGKPVIGTGWSANMDFMTPDNSIPVRYMLKPLEQAVGVYPAGQLWAEADVEHAAKSLQRLLDDPQLRREIGARAAQDIRTQLSPAAVGELVRERLSLINYWHPQLRC